MKIIEDGTVTNPKGYKGAGLHIGIKKKNKDFALIVSDVEAKAVGTFTTNMVKAAPVLWDKQIVENSDTVKAIAINSGIANACTGKLGEEANEKFANIVGNALNVEKEKVLICSTGVIGKQLSTDPIEKGIDEALKQLQDARTQLVLKATDDEVNALKALMDQYQEKDYTVSSWKEFEKVYNDVKAALENENTSDDVQALTNTLKEAAQKLVKRGNLDGIHGLLDQIKQLDSKKYTEASYSKLIDVVTEISKKLENSSEMTQEEVDALVSELQNAINALEKAPTITTDTNEPAHKPQVVTNNKVKTGDSTSVWTFATFALMAAIVYVSLRKRTKED